jgi:hypothetical protein
MRKSIGLMWLRIRFNVRGLTESRFIQEGGKFHANLRYYQILKELHELCLYSAVKACIENGC